MLRLELEGRDSDSVLIVPDTLFGNVIVPPL